MDWDACLSPKFVNHVSSIPGEDSQDPFSMGSGPRGTPLNSTEKETEPVSFKELLARLNEEHERQLSMMRKQLQSCRLEMGDLRRKYREREKERRKEEGAAPRESDKDFSKMLKSPRGSDKDLSKLKSPRGSDKDLSKLKQPRESDKNLSKLKSPRESAESDLSKLKSPRQTSDKDLLKLKSPRGSDKDRSKLRMPFSPRSSDDSKLKLRLPFSPRDSGGNKSGASSTNSRRPSVAQFAKSFASSLMAPLTRLMPSEPQTHEMPPHPEPELPELPPSKLSLDSDTCDAVLCLDNLNNGNGEPHQTFYPPAPEEEPATMHVSEGSTGHDSLDSTSAGRESADRRSNGKQSPDAGGESIQSNGWCSPGPKQRASTPGNEKSSRRSSLTRPVLPSAVFPAIDTSMEAPSSRRGSARRLDDSEDEELAQLQEVMPEGVETKLGERGSHIFQRTGTNPILTGVDWQPVVAGNALVSTTMNPVNATNDLKQFDGIVAGGPNNGIHEGTSTVEPNSPLPIWAPSEPIAEQGPKPKEDGEDTLAVSKVNSLENASSFDPCRASFFSDDFQIDGSMSVGRVGSVLPCQAPSIDVCCVEDFDAQPSDPFRVPVDSPQAGRQIEASVQENDEESHKYGSEKGVPERQGQRDSATSEERELLSVEGRDVVGELSQTGSDVVDEQLSDQPNKRRSILKKTGTHYRGSVACNVWCIQQPGDDNPSAPMKKDNLKLPDHGGHVSALRNVSEGGCYPSPRGSAMADPSTRKNSRVSFHEDSMNPPQKRDMEELDMIDDDYEEEDEDSPRHPHGVNRSLSAKPRLPQLRNKVKNQKILRKSSKSFGEDGGQPTLQKSHSCVSFDEATLLAIEDSKGFSNWDSDLPRQSFCLCDTWALVDYEEETRMRQSTMSGRSNHKLFRQPSFRPARSRGQMSIFSTDTANASHSCDKFVSHPNSLRNFYMDCMCMLLIAYDFVFVPLQLFSPPETSFTDTIYTISAFFWTADVIRNFFIGYYSHGHVMMRFTGVAWKYLTTMFCLDMILVFFDYVYVVMIMDALQRERESVLMILSRGIRLLRCTKIFRLVKMIEDRMTSEFLSVVWKVSKFFAGILILNHLAACLWYWIGKRFQDTHPTWVDSYLHDTLRSSLAYRYATSFHWALTQFTPASIEVQPVNVYERSFAIVVLLFALLTTSTFVSGITSAVMRLGSLKSAKSKQFWLLRRYLKESKVPVPLAVRIHNYCDYAWELQQRAVQESNVQILSLLSTSLRAELRTSIYEPQIEVHPFFVLMGKMAPLTVQALCNSAIATVSLGRGDHLFSRGEDAGHMFFIGDSEDLVYWFLDEEPEDVGRGSDLGWMCEPSLWTEWSHKGTLQARVESTLVAIERGKFTSTIKSNIDTRVEATSYAKGFVQGLNRIPARNLSDLYQTPLLEGLWFRLFKEYNYRDRSASTNRSQRASIDQFEGATRFGRFKLWMLRTRNQIQERSSLRESDREW